MCEHGLHKKIIDELFSKEKNEYFSQLQNVCFIYVLLEKKNDKTQILFRIESRSRSNLHQKRLILCSILSYSLLKEYVVVWLKLFFIFFSKISGLISLVNFKYWIWNLTNHRVCYILFKKKLCVLGFIKVLM